MLIDLSEQSTRISSLLRLENVYLRLQAIYLKGKYNLHIIVTKNIYFIYNYNKRKLPRGKRKHCPMSKNFISSCSAHWTLPAQGWAPLYWPMHYAVEKGRTLLTDAVEKGSTLLTDAVEKGRTLLTDTVEKGHTQLTDAAPYRPMHPTDRCSCR